MTEPREPYIAGRKKVVSIHGVIEGVEHKDFKNAFIDWMMDKGWIFNGHIEVSYEEESK